VPKLAKGLSTLKTPTFCEEGDEFIAVIDSQSIELDLMRLERIAEAYRTSIKVRAAKRRVK
jgi:hypothetical protein